MFCSVPLAPAVAEAMRGCADDANVETGSRGTQAPPRSLKSADASEPARGRRCSPFPCFFLAVVEVIRGPYWGGKRGKRL